MNNIHLKLADGNYLQMKTDESTEEILPKVMNISDLTILRYEKNLSKKIFKTIELSHNRDIVVLKERGNFTKKDLQTQHYFDFNGHTISFIDRESINGMVNGLFDFLDMLATVRGKYQRVPRNFQPDVRTDESN